MVTIYIGGGLANKMFQYAFSLAIMKQGYEVRYDTHAFRSEFEHDKMKLTDIFPNVSLNESPAKWRLLGKNNKMDRLIKRINPYYIIERAYQYNDRVWNQIKAYCAVDGSWQDERYFESVSESVRKAFEFPEIEGDKNKSIQHEMMKSNSVAIHIRKGDGYGTWSIFSNTCPKEYYDKAICYIRENVSNPKFYVFSDNPEIVSQYLDIDDYMLINWNPNTGWGNHFDMQLMSCAKHNVIANSTYSWWGAWLNNNPEKIIVAPRYWFNPNCDLAEVNHIIPSRWIKF